MNQFINICKKDFDVMIGDYTRRVPFFSVKKGKKYKCLNETMCYNNGVPVPGIRVFDGKEYYSFSLHHFYEHFCTQIELRKLKLEKINKGNFFLSKLINIFKVNNN